PIATGKGSNARHAINVLAKIGGVKAYQCLKDIASAPGFDLSKTAAKRALEDILRREPELANITAPVEGAKEIFNELTEKVTEAVTEAKEAVTSTVSSQVPVEDTGKLKRDLSSMQNKINNLEHQLSKKNAKVEELEEKIRQLKKNDKVSAELKDVKRTLHESRNETASLKASYEKQLALMKGKVISLEEENDDLMRRNSRKLAPKKSGGGCFSILIFFGIFFFIIWFVFSSIFSEASIQHEIPKEIRQKILNK
ncbi:MAG: hypothetical protein NE327_06915, partial [Lentisphaeraceae bacterium]|nr:hypothetical protein [Lentisphaeraceae bacterium]